MTRKLFSGVTFFVLLITLVLPFFAGIELFASEDYQPPASKDSNRQVDMNMTYQVTYPELTADIVEPGWGIETIRLDESVLHGSLEIRGTEAVVGEIYTITDIWNGVYYTPETDFSGADHFKWQHFDGVNWSNISSFNFDVVDLPDVDHYCPEEEEGEHIMEEESEVVEDGQGGGVEESNEETIEEVVIQENSDTLPTEDVLEDKFGIGGGGDDFTPPEAEEVFETTTNSSGGTGGGGDLDSPQTPSLPLIRTGGYTPSSKNVSSVYSALAVILIIGYGLQVYKKA